MKFKGPNGPVKHRHKEIARFIDGKFETGDEAVIRRLVMLGYEQDVSPPPTEAKKVPVVGQVPTKVAPAPVVTKPPQEKPAQVKAPEKKRTR